MIHNLSLPKTQQELRLRAAQMDREASAQGKRELRSLSKFAFGLGSVFFVAFGVILLALG